METRKAILIYQYSERIKSELIIASGLLARMITLEGEELIGAEKMMTSFLEALAGEIRIAQRVEKSISLLEAENRIMEAIGRMKLLEHSEMGRCISEALSFVTTLGQESMEALMDRHLI